MLRLETSEQQKSILLETMRKYNEACNYVADRSLKLNITTNKYKLQKEVYQDIRKKFGLSSQFAVRIIGKIVEAYKQQQKQEEDNDKTKTKTKPTFKELGAIQYDQRNSKVRIDRVDLITLNHGRIKLRTRIEQYQRLRINRVVRGQSDLIFDKRTKVFYLIVVVDAPEEEEYNNPTDFLGVDMGIENIAVDSDGQIFEGKKVEDTRKKYFKLRRGLQKVNTTSAKRKLKKISGRERPFKKDTNHVISAAIVSKAKGINKAIVLENLKGIRFRTTVKGNGNKAQRDKHSKWAFGQLRDFITYKAKVKGVPLKIISSKNTSRECPSCGYIDTRNRQTRNNFECLQCQYKGISDYIAALNIRNRAAVNQPIVASLFSVVTRPHALAVGS